MLSLQDNYNEFRKDFLTYVKLLGNNRISETNINKNKLKNSNNNIKFNINNRNNNQESDKNNINNISKFNLNNNSNKLKSNINSINNILKFSTIGDKSKLKCDINDNKLQNNTSNNKSYINNDLIISAHNVEANKEKVEYFNNKDFNNKPFEYSKKFLQNINNTKNRAVFPNNILKYLINTNNEV